MNKKRKKNITIKDCSRNRRPNILQQLICQNYTGLYTVFDIGSVWGGCALSEAENFVILKLKSCNIYGNISTNLDQVTSKEKEEEEEEEEEEEGEKQRKNMQKPQTDLEEFLIKFC